MIINHCTFESKAIYAHNFSSAFRKEQIQIKLEWGGEIIMLGVKQQVGNSECTLLKILGR